MNLSKKKLASNSTSYKITPDFVPMIRIIFWNSMGFFFFSFLIPYVTAQLLGASGTQLGFMYASQIFGALISAPIVGYLTDRFSKKLLVLIGSFGRGTSYLLMYLGIIFSSLMIFAIGLFVQGFFVGFFWTPLDALISEKSHKTNRSYAFGKRGGMMGWGNFFGSILSFIIFGIANYFVPNNRFLVYSPLILFTISNVYAGIIFNRHVNEELTYDHYITNIYPPSAEFFIESQTIDVSSSNSQTRNNLAFGFLIGFIFLTVAFMTSNINQSLAPPFFQVYLIDEIGVNNATMVMLIYFPSQIIAMLLAPKLGKISDKINPMLGIAIASSFGSLVTWLIVNTTSGWEFGVILTFDATFAWAGMLILQNFVSRVSKSHRGKIFGLTQWMSLFGALIGPILGGLVWDHIGPRAPFIISIFVELSVIPLYFIAIRFLNPHMAEKIEEN